MKKIDKNPHQFKMDSLIDIPPEENPENMPSATEELLQIMEDFADYIDKFMFEIVTLLAVVDSAMGLIKDVLGLFGFEGWKMAFFPTFSFIVTTGVFLFGAKKRKGKRDSPEAPEGLAEAFDAIEDVMEVVEDVAEGLEEIENEGGGDDGDLGKALGDVVGSSVSLPMGISVGDSQGIVNSENGNENGQEDSNTVNTPTDGNQNIARKVIAVAVLAAGILAKLKKKRAGDQEEDVPTTDAQTGGEGSSRDVQGQETGVGLEMRQRSLQQGEWLSGKAPAKTGALDFTSVNHNPHALNTCGLNDSVVVDLNPLEHGKRFAETDWQNAAKTNVISAERHLRWSSRQIARGVEQGASEITSGFKGASLPETSINIKDNFRSTTHLGEDTQVSELLKKSPAEMASGMVQNTTNMAGSAIQGADQQARKGIEETRKKSGSILHIAIRLVRLAVRVVNKKKGGSSASSQKSEDSTGKAGSTDIKGSTVSLESDSVYFDCVSTTPAQTQRYGTRHESYKSLMSTGTQTDRDNTQPQYRSEPYLLFQDSIGMFAHEPKVSPWDNLRRSVLSMPDNALFEMRHAADEEMKFRGATRERLKPVNKNVDLRPAWLGSRDEMARRANESHLHISSPFVGHDRPGPSSDEYTRVSQNHGLDAPVILHRGKDSEAPTGVQKTATPTYSHERDKAENYPVISFRDAERPAGEDNDEVRPEGSGHEISPVWDRGRSPSRQTDYSNEHTFERNKSQRGPHNWDNDAKSLDDGSDVYRDRGKRPRERKMMSAPNEWQGPDDERYAKPRRQDRDIRDRGKDPRKRNIRSSSSYEGLEEYEDRKTREQFPSEDSPKRQRGFQRMNGKPDKLRRSVSYDLTEDEFVLEGEDLRLGSDLSLGRFASSARISSKSNHGKHPMEVSPSKSGPVERVTSQELSHDRQAYFSKPREAYSPGPPSESSGSVESARSQRQSYMSLSSVRFADEEPGAKAGNSRMRRDRSQRGKYNDNYLFQQPMKQGGQRDSLKKRQNGRWNSAVCLTGHQKAPELYTNDDYISDKPDSPRARYRNRTGINRGPSFNRLSRGPSTIIRTRSANYLGDDESDDRA